MESTYTQHKQVQKMENIDSKMSSISLMLKTLGLYLISSTLRIDFGHFDLVLPNTNTGMNSIKVSFMKTFTRDKKVDARIWLQI